jgi:transposase
VAPTPVGLDLHCAVDNLATHTTPQVTEFLENHRHVHLHFTPAHASWLNQVELFFSILERRLLSRGQFDSVDHLARRVMDFIKDYNRRAAPFRWTYDGRPRMAA